MEQVVRKAVHRKTGETFVVKCFNIFDESKRRMLKDEMDIMLQLDDASIVKFHGAYLDEDQRVLRTRARRAMLTQLG